MMAANKLMYDESQPYVAQLKALEKNYEQPRDREAYQILFAYTNPDATMGMRLTTEFGGDKTYIYQEHYRETYSFGLSTATPPAAGYGVNNQLPDNVGMIVFAKDAGAWLWRYIGVTNSAQTSNLPVVPYNGYYTNPDVVDNEAAATLFPLDMGDNWLHPCVMYFDTTVSGGIAAHSDGTTPYQMCGEFETKRYFLLSCNGATGGTPSVVTVTIAGLPEFGGVSGVSPPTAGVTKVTVSLYAYSKGILQPVVTATNWTAAAPPLWMTGNASYMLTIPGGTAYGAQQYTDSFCIKVHIEGSMIVNQKVAPGAGAQQSYPTATIKTVSTGSYFEQNALPELYSFADNNIATRVNTTTLLGTARAPIIDRGGMYYQIPIEPTDQWTAYINAKGGALGGPIPLFQGKQTEYSDDAVKGGYGYIKIRSEEDFKMSTTFLHDTNTGTWYDCCYQLRAKKQQVLVAIDVGGDPTGGLFFTKGTSTIEKIPSGEEEHAEGGMVEASVQSRAMNIMKKDEFVQFFCNPLHGQGTQAQAVQASQGGMPLARAITKSIAPVFGPLGTLAEGLLGPMLFG